MKFIYLLATQLVIKISKICTVLAVMKEAVKFGSAYEKFI